MSMVVGWVGGRGKGCIVCVGPSCFRHNQVIFEVIFTVVPIEKYVYPASRIIKKSQNTIQC